MRDINEIDIRLVDTTILMVFLSAMRNRKATAVAKEMGLTQPAVSHALNRLRVIFDDRLFLRRAHGLEPTALAHELEPKVRKIVSLISETLKGFDLPQKEALGLLFLCPWMGGILRLQEQYFRDCLGRAILLGIKDTCCRLILK